MPALLRAEWLLAQYGVPIAIALVLLGVLSIGGAWSVYDNPTTERITSTSEELQVDAGLNTSAVVSNNSALYAPNTTLRNESVYFYNGTQNVTVHLETMLRPPRNASVETRLLLRHEADRGNRVFWSHRRLLAARNETVTGNTSTVNATLNMSAVRAFVEETRAAVGGVGTVQSHLVANVSYDTETYAGTITGSSRVVTTSRAYWFEGTTIGNRSHVATLTREVTRDPDMTMVAGLAGVGLLLLIGAGGVVLVQRRSIDITRIEAELTRTRYDEWISKGEIPTKLQKAYVKTDALVDLVDIAIDSNKRVIYDTEYDAYAVVETDVVYYYSEGETGLDQWLDL